MKLIKSVSKILYYAFALYIGIFGIWIMLAVACASGQDRRGCGDDALSRVIRVTHAPLIKILFNVKER